MAVAQIVTQIIIGKLVQRFGPGEIHMAYMNEMCISPGCSDEIHFDCTPVQGVQLISILFLENVDNLQHVKKVDSFQNKNRNEVYGVYRRTVNNHGGFGSGVYCILNIGIHHKVTCSPTNDCEGNLEHMIGAKGAGDGIRAARGTETESAKKRRPEPDSPIS